MAASSAFPAPQQPLSGSYMGFMGSDFPQFMDAFKDINDPDVRQMMMGTYMIDRMNKQNAESRRQELLEYPNIIKQTRAQQLEDYEKLRPLQFQELVARKFLDTVTELPGKIAAARHIYGPEEIRGINQGMNYGSVPIQRLF